MVERWKVRVRKGEGGGRGREKMAKRDQVKKLKVNNLDNVTTSVMLFALRCRIRSAFSGVSPEVRQLLRVCEEGGGEEALVKLLQVIGLSPLHAETHTTTPSAIHTLTLSPTHTTTPSVTQASGRYDSVPEMGGQTDSSSAETTSDNWKGIHGNTGVHGNTAILNALQGGQTLLHVAAQSGQANIVHVLLQYGADPAIR